MPKFTGERGDAASIAMEDVLSAGMLREHTMQQRRTYLGFSRVGEECERMLGYEYHAVPKDPGRGFAGRTLRIFDRGHVGEERVKRYLRAAGFSIVDAKHDGGQIGVYMLPHPETGKPRLAGHIDGVVTGWQPPVPSGVPVGPDNPPYELPMAAAQWVAALKLPALWENKILNSKNFKKLQKEGLKKAKPVYYGQMQSYMAYLDLADHPGIFTAENADTCEIYVELVPFDARVAQDLSDKAVRIVSSRKPEELACITRDPSDFRCRFCDYAERCHSTPAPIAQGHTPGWLQPVDPAKL